MVWELEDYLREPYRTLRLVVKAMLCCPPGWPTTERLSCWCCDSSLTLVLDPTWCPIGGMEDTLDRSYAISASVHRAASACAGCAQGALVKWMSCSYCLISKAQPPVLKHGPRSRTHVRVKGLFLNPHCEAKA